jgi:hypothetical protein
MRNRTRIAVIALVAVLGVGAAGLAWAWFTETTTATASGGAGADLAPATVTTPLYVYDNSQNGLYPNHWADVKLTVANPSSNNVDITVTSVVPATSNPKNVSATTPNNSANRTYCEGLLTMNAGPTIAAESNDLVLAPGDSVVVVLTDAVSLDASADNRCQGMVFETNWSVVTQAS